MGQRADIAYAIDLGSNAVRMSIARRTREGFKELEGGRAAIRLGHDVFTQGRVSPASVAALERAFAEFERRISARGCGLGRAVATAALREAKNGEEVARRLSRRLPAPLEPISGLEEAALIRRAVQARLDLRGLKSCLLVEVGGGSAEVTLLSGGRPLFSECLKIGAVRLLEMLGDGPAGERRFDALVEQYTDRVLRNLKAHLPGKPSLLVGTGGNIEALGQLAVRLAGARRGRDGLVVMGPRHLDSVMRELEALSVEGRVARLGLRPDRADVIVPAAVVYRSLLRALGLRQISVPGANLRQGLLLALFESHLPGQPAEGELAAIRAAADQYARRYRVEMGHARHVQALALSLFDQLRGLMGEDGRGRLLLELAALLHDSGYHISDESHHKHSYYLISQAMDFPGLSREEHEVAALVARYHRRSHPKREHAAWAALPAKARQRVARLAGVLRVADALDRAHRGTVRSVLAHDNGSTVEIVAGGKGPLELERWSFQKKAMLFEEAFDRRVVLREEK